ALTPAGRLLGARVASDWTVRVPASSTAAEAASSHAVAPPGSSVQSRASRCAIPSCASTSTARSRKMRVASGLATEGADAEVWLPRLAAARGAGPPHSAASWYPRFPHPAQAEAAGQALEIDRVDTESAQLRLEPVEESRAHNGCPRRPRGDVLCRAVGSLSPGAVCLIRPRGDVRDRDGARRD